MNAAELLALADRVAEIRVYDDRTGSTLEDVEAYLRQCASLAAQPAPPCPQINSGVLCGVPRKPDERLCPDCNPQRPRRSGTCS